MSTEDNKLVIQRFLDEALNRKNLDALDTLVAENFVEQVPFPARDRAGEGLRSVLAAFISAFPDMHWSTDEQIAEGENVVTRFTMTGTHQGAFLGIPPTGKSVHVWGVVMDVVRGGQLAESRILMDTVSLLQQLGVMPSP